MKNFEKYKPEILAIPAKSTLFNLIDFFKNHGCSTVYEGLQWLYQEDEPFTEEEKIILKNVDKKYSYIARDEDGSIQLFEVRPFKIDVTQGYYEADGTHYNFNCYKNIFSKITYKNGPVQFRSDEDDD